jgi:hypothetical protein
MEVGQGPNWGCSAKEKKMCESYETHKYAVRAKCRQLFNIMSGGMYSNHCDEGYALQV